MDTAELNKYYSNFKYGEDSYHYLMANKVHEILLVSTFYDAFIFEQDGRLSEQIFGEYRQLNLSTAPKITSVPTGEDAISLLKTRKFDLVITMMHIGKTSAFELSKQIKADYPDLPIVLLLSLMSDKKYLDDEPDSKKLFDNVFLWNGDAKLFLAIVKSIEDKRNIEYDTKHGMVRVILLVEDSIKFYSMFLPILYQEIVKQTQFLIKVELNDINKRLRMRARPKVIIVDNFEDACKYLKKYKEFIISVISDICYQKEGVLDDDAGIKFISKVKETEDTIATLLLSSEYGNKAKADEINAHFLHKSSKHLLTKIRKFILNNLGFGEFVFRNVDGHEISRAGTLAEFEDKLKKIDDTSLVYHSQHNHFSAWLMARGEIRMAKKLRPLQLADFKSVADMRSYLIDMVNEIQSNRNKGKIINLHDYSEPEVNEIIRVCEGSLGGKGRGLAFLNALLVSMEFEKQFPDVHVQLPSTLIIGTNEFDQFIESNNINDQAIEDKTDDQIDTIFLNASLSSELDEKLNHLLEKITYPIAVRSSGLLEDSIAQPLAGVYRTFMLPNNHSYKSIRLKQVKDAIKLVYASVYLKNAREYIESMAHQLEEEKMAIIIQEVVGSNYDNKCYYPHISGIAQSYNFYPISPMKHEDGVVSIAAGLGKSVVDGGRIHRFCPNFPKAIFLKPQAIINESQKEIYALNLTDSEYRITGNDDGTLKKIELPAVLKHGSMKHIVSIWNRHDNRFVHNLNSPGTPVITFDNIIKYEYFPLAAIIQKMLDIGQTALGMPVEIEFAINLEKDRTSNKPSFYILQIRPLSVSSEEVNVDQTKHETEDIVAFSTLSMGNGKVSDVCDIIYIDHSRFDKTKTLEMQREVEAFNEQMKKENRQYILIGPGRWGSMDRFLGIPVRYVQINQAAVIIETGLEDFNIDPSQGSHFFHNIISRKIGYLSVPYNDSESLINWNWINSQYKVKASDYFIHVKTEKPLQIMMDGKSGQGLILKPEDI